MEKEARTRNARRGQRALRVLVCSRALYDGVNREDIIDSMTDLMHASRELKMDTDQMVSMAIQHFTEEVIEEGDPDEEVLDVRGLEPGELSCLPRLPKGVDDRGGDVGG